MLEFQNISASCHGTTILNHVSTTFPKGKITTILGPNGCGKTTLLQCLNGSSKIIDGHIFLDGLDFQKMSSTERAQKLSFLPQIRTVIPALPVKTLVEHGRFPYLGFTRKKSAKDIEIVQNVMSFTHISDYADQYVDTLSGGIRQRVFLAMILAQDCDYIILDEPTTYLDLKGQKEFLELFARLREMGKTVILVLHDLNQSIRISDKLIIMKDRKIAVEGTPKECLQQHVFEYVFETDYKKFSDADGDYYFFH